MRNIEIQDAEFQTALSEWSESGTLPDLPCEQTDPEVFFPETESMASTKDAKQICKSCPFIVECLKGALAREEQWGVWGGLNTRERKAILKKGYRAA